MIDNRRLAMAFEVFCRFCNGWVDTEDIEVKDVSTNIHEEDVIIFAHLDCNPAEQQSVVRGSK